MAKQLQYKNITFSLSPAEELANHDMSFDIHIDGEFAGRTIYGGIKNWERFFNSEVEKDAFMDFADVEAHKEEARLKFAYEFNCPVEEADKLNIPYNTIIEVMDRRWAIPSEIMLAILPTSSEYLQ
ncbi:hypothetical protein P4U99_22925 [Brevibacillus agri]|uniref:hypothetical protein n=1 Tax=Brevibacillus TaxID=55080 RepID=UPI001562953F|nr:MULTISPECIES: hypothetical protein [Brevibacillus]MBE5393810.1 hypothetical protein [Brevibacillus borstelensis]MED1646005.1 hypothetical protein [Brevibacillus agri]MED1656318.1 hypothetical protein [Brevibacillus agri]MED1689240.1 hypothetical protein [Brevibacillus agri]MED1693763.1 hypothetical protein [Brevibacillus agri]